jgi:hypothetical protein
MPNGWESDDDEEFLPGIGRDRSGREEDLFYPEIDDERSLAAMRGALAIGKRVPSKEALASLESVDLGELKDSDRCKFCSTRYPNPNSSPPSPALLTSALACIICYNEFGISNPEGITENPIRLPKCKHLFGDKCIKKWFEDSDSCPYCRDKLPSELAIKKHPLYQTYRVTSREFRLAQFGHRARHALSGVPSAWTPDDPRTESRHAGSLAPAVQRAQDDYEYMMTRQVESLGYSPPNRFSGESPERRRQARGRVGSNRANYMLGRPTSVGSARSINPPFNHQNNAYRAFGLGSTAPPPPSAHTHTPRRSITPGLSRQPSNPGSSNANAQQNTQTPPRNNRPSTVLAAPATEEASPPVAVGSGVSTRYNQTDSQSRALRLSLDSLSNLSAAPWGSSQGMSRQQPPSHSMDNSARAPQPQPQPHQPSEVTDSVLSFGGPFGAISPLPFQPFFDGNNTDNLNRQSAIQTNTRETGTVEESVDTSSHARWLG